MEDKFVPYPIALMLKELGYNEPCLAWFGVSEILNHVGEIKLYMVGQPNNYEIYTTKTEYFFCNQKDTDVDAPLWQQVIDWFREKYDIHFHIDYNKQLNIYGIHFQNPITKEKGISVIRDTYKTYEEAREQAILKALEIIKRNNHGKII